MSEYSIQHCNILLITKKNRQLCDQRKTKCYIDTLIDHAYKRGKRHEYKNDQSTITQWMNT